MTTAHARHRRQLELLADPAEVAALMGPGRRHYGRFHPGRPIWATLVIDVEGRGLTTLELSEAPLPGSAPHPVLGHLRRSRPADDPGLPGLGPVIDQLESYSILRYRPRKRCTLRAGTDAGAWIVKVVAAQQGGGPSQTTRLHHQQTELHLAHQRGHLDARVAAPGPPDRHALWQGVVPGQPIVADLLGPDGPALAQRLGRTLGRMAVAPLDPATVDGPPAQLARTARAVARLVDRVPELAGAAGTVLDHLAYRHRRLDPRPGVPVHGAPHMHQWLLDGDHLGLIDFDRYHRGEPELDIATLVAELESESELVTSPEVIEASIVAGFEAVGPTLDPARLALYRTHKRLAKATRSAWALRPDGDERAARHLGRLVAGIEPGP